MIAIEDDILPIPVPILFRQTYYEADLQSLYDLIIAYNLSKYFLDILL